MDELYPNYFEIGTAITASNADLSNQNERLISAYDLTDADIKQIVISGLAREQQDSFDERNRITTSVDFAALGTDYNALIEAKNSMQSSLDDLEHQIQLIDEQVAKGALLAPSQTQLLQDLADSKKSTLHSEVEQITQSIRENEAKELGFVALSAAWVRPLVPGVNTTTVEVAIDLTDNASHVSSKTQKPEVSQQDMAQDVDATTFENQSTTEELESILQSVLWAVYDYASKNSEQGVRLEEMRKVLPELSQLSNNEYEYFKKHFSRMRDQIAAKLASMGVNTRWQISGQTRGTRYHVINEDGPPRAKLPQQSSRRRPNTGSSKTAVDTLEIQDSITIVSTSQTTTPRFIDETLDIESIQELPIVRTIINLVANLQVMNEAESQKRTYLTRQIASELGIDGADAGFILSKLVGIGLLYERGHQKGVRLLSTFKGAEATSLVTESDKADSKTTPDPITEQEIIEDETSETAEERILPIGVLKRGMNANENTFSHIGVQDIGKALGIKNDRHLEAEVKKWVEWIVDNPLTPGTRKIKAFKSIKIDSINTPLFRFSPMECTELTTSNKYRRYRLVYAYVDNQIVLIDLLDHDTFDAKYN